jgi:hypothetical protein
VAKGLYRINPKKTSSGEAQRRPEKRRITPV